MKLKKGSYPHYYTGLKFFKIVKPDMINNEDTELIYSKVFCQHNDIIYSITTPVYNQEDIIVENIKSIIENTVENFGEVRPRLPRARRIGLRVSRP